MALINCELKLTLTWSENCVLTTKAYRGKIVGTGTDENPQFREINNPTNATFQRTDTRLYVPVVTFSTQNDNKLLKQLRTGFKRTIKWNKYRLEMTNQTKSNNLNFLKSIDCLSYHLKMKTIEHLFQSIMCQTFK